MNLIKWTVIVAALIVAGFMALDGSRALLTGEYFTPKSGRYAGQLGPWSSVVSAVGIEPRSTVMKTIFAVYGFVWLLVIGLFVLDISWAWWGMLIAALGSLWFLPFGTLLGAIQIVLLLLPQGRALAEG